MYVEEKCIALKCDGCGEFFYDDDYGFSAFIDEGDAKEHAEQHGWLEIDGKHYCKKCYHYDEETDEYVPNKKEE